MFQSHVYYRDRQDTGQAQSCHFDQIFFHYRQWRESLYCEVWYCGSIHISYIFKHQNSAGHTAVIFNIPGRARLIFRNKVACIIYHRGAQGIFPPSYTCMPENTIFFYLVRSADFWSVSTGQQVWWENVG